MKKKKPFIASLVGVLVVVIIICAVFAVKEIRFRSLTAEVQLVSNVATSYWGDTVSCDGQIVSQSSQNIYYDSNKVITEVFVSEGDEVNEGDKLLSYDTSSLSLSVEMKKIDVASAQNTFTSENAKLTQLRATTPSTGSVTPPVEEETGYLPTVKKSGSAYNYIEAGDPATSVDGSGSHYLCTKQAYLTGEFLNELAASGDTAIFEVHKQNNMSNPLVTSFTVVGSSIEETYDDEAILLIFYDQDTILNGLNSGSEPILPEVEGYTKEELAMMIAKQEVIVKRADINLRKAQKELSDLEAELSDGVVYATVSGKVTKACTIEEPPTDGSPFLTIAGSDGLYMRGSINELLLDTISIGTSVSALNWETGEMIVGEIVSIDNFPLEDMHNYYNGNTNSSYYGYVAKFEEGSENFNDLFYVELQIQESEYFETTNTSFYMDKAYIRKDADGKSYVLKQEDGKLVKQNVVVGKTLWGSYTEIKSGITQEDYIAFPYGKNAIEGVKTKETSGNYF